MDQPKSFEQAVEYITRQIREQHHKIIDDFYKAYAAQLCHLEDFSLDDICLIEQEPHYREGCLTRRYWFEYKPKFEDKMEWISVKDKEPPKDGSPFLCYDPNQIDNFPKACICVVCFQEETNYFKSGYVETGGECYFRCEPTYWMPLPSPPKEGL